MMTTAEEAELTDPFGTGCLICGKEDNEDKILLCETCDGEYHTYCLNPPLHGIPEGDWFCDECSNRNNDGMEEQVAALPPSYSSRFGEICWAQGGTGYGWWPSIIYDPRLTIEPARSQARKFLGRKHLVYFFRCGPETSPFSILPTKQIKPWLEGLAEELYLGRAARNHGKQRYAYFQEALEIAWLEMDKAADERLDWEHPNASSAPQQQNGTTSVGNTGGANTQGDHDDINNKIERKKNTKKGILIRTPATRMDLDELLKHQEELRVKNTIPEPNEKAKSPEKKSHKRSLSFNASQPSPTAKLKRRTTWDGSPSDRASQAQEAIQQLDDDESMGSNDSKEENKKISSTTERKSSEDMEEEEEDKGIVCKIETNTGKPVGFVLLPPKPKTTFGELRKAITDELVPDCMPNDFKFFIPKLGPVSQKQERTLKDCMSFLRKIVGKKFGEGTYENPISIVVNIPS